MAKGLKILVYIRAKINFQNRRCHESVWKRTHVCLHCLNTSKEDSLGGQKLSKDHSCKIAEISWVYWGQKALKQQQQQQKTPPTSQVFWERKNPMLSSKNKLQYIHFPDTTGTKRAFWQQTHQMGLVPICIK